MLFGCDNTVTPTSSGQIINSSANTSLDPFSINNFPTTIVISFLNKYSVFVVSVPSFNSNTYTIQETTVNGQPAIIVYGFYNNENEVSSTINSFGVACQNYGFSVEATSGYYRASSSSAKFEILFSGYNLGTSHQFGAVFCVKSSQPSQSATIQTSQEEWNDSMSFPREELYAFFSKYSVNPPYVGSGSFVTYDEHYKYKEASYNGKIGFLVRVTIQDRKLQDALSNFTANLSNNGYSVTVKKIDDNRKFYTATSSYGIGVYYGPYRFSEDERFFYGADVFYFIDK